VLLKYFSKAYDALSIMAKSAYEVSLVLTPPDLAVKALRQFGLLGEHLSFFILQKENNFIKCLAHPLSTLSQNYYSIYYWSVCN
jgi:hypothetical protein